MTVRQWIIGAVRTGVQRLIAIGLGGAAAWLAMKGFDVDLDLTGTGLLVAVDVTVTGLVTGAIIKLEEKFPQLAKVFSIGLASSGPSYETTQPQV